MYSTALNVKLSGLTWADLKDPELVTGLNLTILVLPKTPFHLPKSQSFYDFYNNLYNAWRSETILKFDAHCALL